MATRTFSSVSCITFEFDKSVQLDFFLVFDVGHATEKNLQLFLFMKNNSWQQTGLTGVNVVKGRRSRKEIPESGKHHTCDFLK